MQDEETTSCNCCPQRAVGVCVHSSISFLLLKSHEKGNALRWEIPRPAKGFSQPWHIARRRGLVLGPSVLRDFYTRAFDALTWRGM